MNARPRIALRRDEKRALLFQSREFVDQVNIGQPHARLLRFVKPFPAYNYTHT
ncbi:MAG TPA: hypothetical protein VK436_15755 [Methanocella sp.]|nr:hypothetical protein [Methanocella sp.]